MVDPPAFIYVGKDKIESMSSFNPLQSGGLVGKETNWLGRRGVNQVWVG